MPLQIAINFHCSRRQNRIVSLISIVATLSIAIGVAVLIIGLSAMNGFEYELKHRILAVVPQGEIEPVNPPFYNWNNIIQSIKKVDGILYAAPYINFTAVIERDLKLKVIQVRGVDPEQELELSSLPSFVQNDSWRHFASGNKQIIIGKGIADTLNIKQGNWLTIMINNSNPNNQLLQPKHIRLQVIGIISMKSQLDHSLAIVPLADAQSYLDKQQEYISGIAIKCNNLFYAAKLVHDAGVATNSHVYVRSWIDKYGYMYRDIQMIRSIIYLAIILVIGVACFNIVSILVIVVKDKSRNIAILRTIGAKDYLISTIFVWYGLLTGLTGIWIGSIVGILISLNLTQLVQQLEYVLGYHLLSGNIYFIDFLPTELHWIDIIIVLGMAMLLSLLSSLYPAKHAININPVIVLHEN